MEAPSREDLKGLRFAVPRELARDGVEPGVREVFEATLETIERLGGEIAEVARCPTPSTASPPTT